MHKARLILFSTVLMAASSVAFGADTFIAAYDGNTGNGGLDADVAGGNTAAASTGSAVIDNADSQHGAGSLDPSAASSGGNALTYETAGNFAVTSTSAGTIEMWVKATPDPAIANQYLFSTRLPGFEGEVGLLMFTSNPGQFGETRIRGFMDTFSAPGGNGTIWFTDSTLINFTWDANVFHHVAWEWDFSDPQNPQSALYIDGVVERFQAAGCTDSSGMPCDPNTEFGYGNSVVASTFEIGSQQGGFDPLLGRIDDVRLSDTAVYGFVNSFTPPGPFVSTPPPGDADCDGDVDLDDFNILAANFGQGTTVGKAVGDFDGDGDTDLDDFNILAANFGTGVGPESVNGLPEPASATLVVAAFATLAGRRRRSV